MNISAVPFKANQTRSIFMPPEVEPEQPHTMEPMMRMAMQKVGHRFVSGVANHVVVVIEHIWNEAIRKASPKER